jgi:hypothetical protein
MPVSVPTGSALALIATRAGVVLDAERAVRLMPLVSTNPTAAIVQEEMGAEKRGSTVKINFKVSRHGTSLIPKVRGDVVVGNTATRDTKTDSLGLDYLVLSDGEAVNAVADQGNVNFALVENEQILMAREASEIIEMSFMNQLCGYTPVNDLAVYPVYGQSGCNPCTEPDTSHHFFAGGKSSEATVAADSNAQLTNRDVDGTIRKMRSLDYMSYPISPADTPWGERYIAIPNGDGMAQVKENNTDSDIYDLSKAQLQGGGSSEDNPVTTVEGFMLNSVVYLESDYATFGTSGGTPGATTTGSKRGNCKRCPILGARALHVIYGEGYVDGLHLGYAEHQVLRNLTMIIDTVWGTKAAIVNAQRWGSAVITHYSPVA